MFKHMRRTLQTIAYPGTMISGLGLFWYLLNHTSLQLSVYVAIIIGTGAIILFEWLLPNKSDWKPNKTDYKNEALYLSIVQILIPQLVTLSVIFHFYEPVQNMLPNLSNLWPHEWPFWIQFLCLLLIVDFLRYWVHRIAHSNSVLWRLHAVHHSPKKMYWLNTVRFHPLEKVIQLIFDSIPFLLLGVQAEVLAAYYVFYALNGFFQHCNIKLRLGWLNYIMSTAELHRWHHSRVPSESNTNFGNNLIIWDLVFNSYYLPREKELKELGLINRQYPQSFSDQLKAPFVDELDQTNSEITNWKDIIHFQIIKLVIFWIKLKYYRPFSESTRNPRATQQRVLNEILNQNITTRYADQHGFEEIRSYADFVKAVPVNEYENLRKSIESQEKTGNTLITADKPVYYSVTSGTTDKPKYIPLSELDIQRLKHEQALFSLEVFRSRPTAFMGKMLMITSPAIEGYTDKGIPFGSASGLLANLTPKLFKSKQVVPEKVFDIKDYPARYLTILCFALLEGNISYMGSANPSSLLKLNSLLAEKKDILIKAIYNGELPEECHADESTCSQFRKKAFQSVQRRQVVVDKLREDAQIADLWPHLKLLNTWTGGSCGIALQSLKALIPNDCQIAELGLVSSELRVTYPLKDQQGGLPNIGHAFFEFVEKSDWEEGRRRFHLLHELTQGVQYYLFFTNHSGLYRYAINDIVEVSGFYHKTPLLKFIQKGQGVTNITGEKLYEHQVIHAVQSVQIEQTQEIPFFVLLADIKNAQYQLIVEGIENSLSRITELGKQIDEFIGKLNIEYQAKRQSQRLKPLEVINAKPGFSEDLKTLMVSAGQREGQYKPKLLWYKNEFPTKLLQEMSQT